MIIQGTTPTHTFTLPFDTTLVKRARFVYSQAGEVKVIKDSTDGSGDVRVEDGKASAKLTQEDTFSLEPCTVVELVLRLLMTDGTALETEPELMMCRETADKEVLA